MFANYIHFTASGNLCFVNWPWPLSARHTALALIVNEMVSNAIKHGKAETLVTITQIDHRVVVTDRTTGQGFPMDLIP